MIVCVCHRVSDREIIRHAKAGLSFDDIQFELGVATQCGQCENCARDVVAQCAASHPVAAIRSEAQAVHLVRSQMECKPWNSSPRSVPA
ncbi:MAG: (2Fe-2S)-binding protein [Xylophilus ampelinus]